MEHLARPRLDAPGEDGTSSLSKLLREGTRVAHEQAEGAAFVGALFRGRLAKEDYVRLLASLLPVYTELETALERHRDVPALAPLVIPALWRREALRRDLAFYGVDPATTVRPPTAAQQYPARIRMLADEKPYLLIAHAYTRYLGDLSGGQALRKALVKAYGLEEPAGVAFYHFELEDMRGFKDEYRARLDALPLTDEQRAAVVEEAVVAFELNQAVFEALQAAEG